MNDEEYSAILGRLSQVAQGDQEADMEFTIHSVEDMHALIAEIGRIRKARIDDRTEHAREMMMVRRENAELMREVAFLQERLG